jgi:hypothetical protein
MILFVVPTFAVALAAPFVEAEAEAETEVEAGELLETGTVAKLSA